MSWEINKKDLLVGVIGAGTMGRGIAQLFAQSYIKVLMYDLDEKILNDGITFAKK